MFSQASVSHSVHSGWVSLVPCPFRGDGVGISGHRSLGESGYVQGRWVCPAGWVCPAEGPEGVGVCPGVPNLDIDQKGDGGYVQGYPTQTWTREGMGTVGDSLKIS